MTAQNPVLIATDLTEASDPALVRGFGHAQGVGAPYVVCHVIPDVFRHHPLAPRRDESDLLLVSDLTKRAAELVTEQVRRVLGEPPDNYRVVIETGNPQEEIVRIAEAEQATLIAVGAEPRHGVERILGHVAERVVRYAHVPVLVARRGTPTSKVLVATDFTDGSLPALRVAASLMRGLAVQGTLLHVMQLPSTALASITLPLGSAWLPPPKAAMDQLEGLGRNIIDGLAKEYGFAHTEQVEGNDAADTIVARAEALGAEMILMGSRGRTGLARLVLGSTAEKVIKRSTCSVLIARGA